MATHNHRDRDGDLVAFYAKSYFSNSISYAVEASVFAYDDNNYHLSFHFLQANRGKPPTDFLSPDNLFTFALKHALSQPVEINFFGTYKYLADSWSTMIPLPMEMPSQLRVVRGIPFTHIDGMRFSDLVDGETRKPIQISVSDDGEISHRIELFREKIINPNSLRSLFREGTRMSLGFVTKKQGASDGN